MNRYADMFSGLKNTAGAFIPFAVLGNPTPEASLRIIEALVEGGADALELGIPFSDPVADGPAIQGAARRALQAHTTPTLCFELIGTLRAQFPKLPIGLLVYANVVVAGGIRNFYARAQKAGVDSVLVADVPLFESAPFVEAAHAAQIAPVFIATPNADENQLTKIAATTEGYTYVVTRFGVTGTRDRLTLARTDMLAELEKRGAPPAVLGFGISNPAHIRAAMNAGAKGAISGSAIAEIIESHVEDPDDLVTRLRAFVSAMKEATRL